MNQLSTADHMASIAFSRLAELSEQAEQLQKAGRGVISLVPGEPDFTTPDHIKEAARKAIENNQTAYPPTAGTDELISAIRAGARRDFDLTLDPDQIVVSAGAIQSLFNLFFSTLNPGDEVILPTPCWEPYFNMIAGCKGIIKSVPCHRKAGFKLTPEQLESAITARTKWLVIISPCNPSGAVFSREEWQALGEVLRRYPHVGLLSDEIYNHIVYSESQFCSALSALPDLADRLVVVNGVSKSYAMTGWRIGYAFGSAKLMAQCAATQSFITSGACTIAQAAAAAAIGGTQAGLSERLASYEERRNRLVSSLNKIEGLEGDLPAGAFYYFPSVHRLIGKKTPTGTMIAHDKDLCHYVLDRCGVAVVPGSFLGMEGHIRLCFAFPSASLDKACLLLADAFNDLRP